MPMTAPPKRSDWVRMRATPEEAEWFRRLAKARGTTVSDLLRVFLATEADAANVPAPAPMS
jgi:hypothetical protein